MDDAERAEVFYQRKKLGQNFLRDKNVLRKICDVAQLREQDAVIEIGPGKGSLTEHIANRAATVIGIEKDDRLWSFLDQKFKDSKNISILYQDVLQTRFERFFSGDRIKLVSNLPYNISTPVLLKIFEERRLFSKIVVMLQKEVAQRISSPSGSKTYGSLSVVLQSCFAVKLRFEVSRHLFFPTPKVDSAVVTLDPLPEDLLTSTCEETFRTVVRQAFSSRRKTLRNSLGSFFTKDVAQRALADSEIDYGRRAESLSVEEFVRLSQSFCQIINTQAPVK